MPRRIKRHAPTEENPVTKFEDLLSAKIQDPRSSTLTLTQICDGFLQHQARNQTILENIVEEEGADEEEPVNVLSLMLGILRTAKADLVNLSWQRKQEVGPVLNEFIGKVQRMVPRVTHTDGSSTGTGSATSSDIGESSYSSSYGDYSGYSSYAQYSYSSGRPGGGSSSGSSSIWSSGSSSAGSSSSSSSS